MMQSMRLFVGMAVLACATGLAAAETFEALDADKNRSLSREEFKGSDLEFRALDLNDDKRISSDEYTQLVMASATNDTFRSMVLVNGAIRSYRFRNDEYPEGLDPLVTDKQFVNAPLDGWGRAYRYVKGRPDLIGDEETPPLDRRRNNIATLKSLRENLKTMQEAGATPPESIVEQIKKLEAENKELEKTLEIPLGYVFQSAGVDGAFDTEDDIIRKFEGFRYRVPPYERRCLIFESEAEVNAVRQAWNFEQAYRLWLSIAEKEYGEGSPVTTLDDVALNAFVFPQNAALDCFGRRFELVTVRGVRAVVASGKVDGAVEVSLTEADFLSLLEVRLNALNNNNYDYSINYLIQAADKHNQSKGRYPLTMPELRRSSSNNSWYFRNATVSYATINEDAAFLFVDFGNDMKPGGVGANADRLYYDDSRESANEETKSNYPAPENNAFNQYAPAIRYAAFKAAVTKAAERKYGKNENKAAEGEDEEGAPLPIIIPEGDKDGKADRVEPVLQEADAEIESKPDNSALESEETLPLESDALVAHSRDLLPKRIYDAGEMLALGINVTDNYQISQHLNRLRYFRQAVQSYTQQNRENAVIPVGNVALSCGEELRAAVAQSGNDWMERWDDEEIDPIDAFIITKPKRDKYNNLTDAFFIAIPRAGSGLPIYIYRYNKRNYNDYYYARVEDQPAGWLEAVKQVDGAPEAKAAANKDESRSEGEPSKGAATGESLPKEKAADKPREPIRGGIPAPK